ncbi:MAG: double zinc ribbon domain-containing protein [Acetobacterium sp.]|uniref:ComF family protein n=1 Tax=Acetobacterium sp. TaxID=1872094 RepID=UPI0032423047
MNLKQALLTFLENNLFLKNGTCPICGKVLFATDRFLCHQCEDDLPIISTPTCVQCGRPIFRANREVCSPCAKLNLPFAVGYTHLNYEDSGKKLVHAIKFKDRPHLGIWVGTQMGEAIAKYQWINHVDLIIPVPLHPHRLEERGYNQSEKIAEGIQQGLSQKHSRVPAIVTDILIRSRDTPHQIGQGREERLCNLTGAFNVETIEYIQNKTVLLVDDVLTTGATLAETSATLLEAGAAQVCIATLCAVAE